MDDYGFIFNTRKDKRFRDVIIYSNYFTLFFFFLPREKRYKYLEDKTRFKLRKRLSLNRETSLYNNNSFFIKHDRVITFQRLKPQFLIFSQRFGKITFKF